MKSQVLHGMDVDVGYGENDMRLLTQQPRSCQTDRRIRSRVNIDSDNGTRFTINWLSVPFCNRTGRIIRHMFIHTIVIMQAALNIIQANPYFHPLRLFWRLLGCPSLKERGKLGLSRSRSLSLFWSQQMSTPAERPQRPADYASLPPISRLLLPYSSGEGQRASPTEGQQEWDPPWDRCRRGLRRCIKT